MAYLLYIFALLAIWLIFAGNTEPATIVVGTAVAVLAVAIFRCSIVGGWMPKGFRPPGSPFSYRRLGYALLFVPVFLWKVVVSGVAIARLALLPGVSFWPGIVAIPGGLPGLGSTAVLANLITLTPGTLTMDYDPERDILYIHWMDVADYAAEDIDHQVTGGMRQWVQHLTR